MKSYELAYGREGVGLLRRGKINKKKKATHTKGKPRKSNTFSFFRETEL